MRKVYIVGASQRSDQLGGWFNEHGLSVTLKPEEADLFQFMGGEDVSPILYHEKNTKSYNNLDRDIYEMGFYNLARKLNIPMAGICRGGQFLNVMCGGSMIQDVKGHTRDHDIITNKGKVIKASSTHHQMMIPGEDALLVAVGKDTGGGHVYHHNISDSLFGSGSNLIDTEVLYYDRQSCLCFQPHPEYYGYTELSDYYFQLIGELL